MPPKTKKSSAKTIDRDEILNQTLANIEKQFGDGAVMKFDNEGIKPIKAIPTGSLNLDIAIGIGGLPRGRIVELYGAESAGKSTLAMSAVAQAQKLGGRCAYIDVEHAMDPEYAQDIGADINNLIISQPDSAEQALEILEHLILSGVIDMVVLDSVAALVPSAEIDGDMGHFQVGGQARLMSQALRKLAGNVHKTNTVCLFINQIREKVGVIYGSPETQPGGRALKFYSSVRLDIRRKESIKGSGNDFLGNRVRVRVVKNKVAPPFKQAELDIIFGEGIRLESDILDQGVETGILERRGAFYSYGDQRLGQGRDASCKFLNQNPELRDSLHAEILKIALPNSIIG